MYKLNYQTQNINVKTTRNELVYIANVITKLDQATSTYTLSSAKIDVRSVNEGGDVVVTMPDNSLIAYYQSGIADFNVSFVKAVDNVTRKEIFNNVSDILDEVLAYVINGAELSFEQNQY